MYLDDYKETKKLIFYSAVPFFDTWPKKFNLDQFINYGFEVELWTTQNIFYKQENIKKASSGSDTYLYRDLSVVKINNLVELEEKLSKLNSKTIICIMTLGSLSRSKFNNPDLNIMNKYSLKYVFHHLLPHLVLPGIWSTFKLNTKLIQKRIYNFKKKPALIIGSGRLGRKQAHIIYNKNFIYKSVPSYNVMWSKSEPIINGKYIVYVEESVDSPPDAALFGINNPNNDIKGFYKRLNEVFEKIEHWTNFKIVIAASGKYKYFNNPFNNRKIIYKKTSNLIQYSELVIGHKSLGVEQAIKDFKPLILLKDEGFNKLKNKIINNLAMVYGLNSLWTTNFCKSNFEKNNFVNIDNYEKIINDYLKEDNVKGTFLQNFSLGLHSI